MSNENNDNKKHELTKKKVRIIGLCLLIGGAVLSIVGIVNFAVSMAKGQMPYLFAFLIFGFPALGIGLGFTIMGFKKEIARYVKNESVPIINEASEEITPAVKAVASAVKSVNSESRKCPVCGAENENDSNFCSECGAKLRIICPACGEELRTDSRFCDKCGYRL